MGIFNEIPVSVKQNCNAIQYPGRKIGIVLIINLSRKLTPSSELLATKYWLRSVDGVNGKILLEQTFSPE